MKRELRKIGIGEFFRLSEKGPVWIRGYYCKDIKKYSCYKYDDCNHENFIKGSKEVYTDFEF